MIGCIDIEVQAHNPQFPLHPLNAYINSPSSIRLRNVPKKIGDWKIERVYAVVKYPNGEEVLVETKLVGGVYIGTFEGCEVSGTSTKGFIVKADGIDENNHVVEGYVLGVGDVFILDNDGRIAPQELLKVVNIVSEKSSNPHIGDALWVDDEFEIFDGVEWKSIGGTKDYNALANKPSINNVELVGDFAPSEIGLQDALPLSEEYVDSYSIVVDNAHKANWADEAGKVDWENVENKSDVVVYDTSEESEKKIVIDGRENGNSVLELNSLGGSLIDLKSDDGLFRIDEYGFTNKFSNGTKRELYASCSEFDVSGDLKENGKRVATQEYVDTNIPTKVSQLDNDSGYTKVVESEENEGYAKNADSADFAVNSQNASYATNADTASFASWAGNVEWDNVQNKPDVPTVNDSTITIKQGGETKGTFTLNQATPSTIELDAGGGSDGGCILEVIASENGGSLQQVSWIGKDNYSYHVKPVNTLYIAANFIARSHGVSVPVNGVLTINWDGYGNDSELVLDGMRTTNRPSTIDSSMYKHILIQFYECLEWNTPITMADGTTKPVGELEDGDIVMSLNPDTMKLEPDDVIFCDGEYNKKNDTADEWTFDDGTVIKTVHPHQFYNVRTGKMEYISDFQIGDKVRKQDGTETALVKHELILKRTKHATLFTRKYNNYFANGILTGNRKSVKWGWYWIEQNKENSNED